MADRDIFNQEEQNVQNLVFDWKNPSMSTRPKRTSAPTPEEAQREELREAVRARKDELMQQRRERAAAAGAAGSRSTSARRVPLRTPGEDTAVARRPSDRGMAERPERGKTKKAGSSLRDRLGSVKLPGRSAQTGGAGAARKGSSKHRKKVIRVWINRGIAAAVVLLVLVLLIWGISHLVRGGGKRSVRHIDTSLPEYVQEDYLTVNSYSRPAIALEKVDGIVVHYTSNPGISAKETRDYFEGLSESHETRASSHFIIGLEGEVLICVPLGEVAYASNSRNMDTISIECCHPDDSGSFTEETYQSLVTLTKWLMERYGLDTDGVLRHYDVTGKLCPKFFVENPDAWDRFKQDVSKG